MFFKLIHDFRDIGENLLGSVGKSENFAKTEDESLFLPLVKVKTVGVEDVAEKDLSGVLRLDQL